MTIEKRFEQELEIFRKEAEAAAQFAYGQAQKPVNVFFKVYVDFAKQPTRELAEKLTPLLHVPLDSLLMEFIAQEFKEEYQGRIVPLRKRLAEIVAQRVGNATRKQVERALFRDEFSLVGINKETYLAWQELLRSLWPGKPVALDIIWVLERNRIRAQTQTPPPVGT